MRKKILFIYTNYSTFVKTDFEILTSVHEVEKYQYKPVKGIPKNAVEFSKQFFFLFFNIWKFDAVFIWFADYHSFFPVLFAKILRKKSYVVVGGYDVANIPELKYGSLSSPFRKNLTLLTYKYASFCLPVVENLENKIKELCPGAHTKTIYTGYNFAPEKQNVFVRERKKIILTVSITNNKQRVLIKGLDRFKELAENLPEYHFYIIGVNENARQLFNSIPSNLLLLPPLKQPELIAYYLKSSFYAQFSRSEGLPNALCEAMLYGCIPMGTNIGGIPMAIGNLGLILKKWNYGSVVEFIRRNHNNLNRETLKNRIVNKFDLKIREIKLLKLFQFSE